MSQTAEEQTAVTEAAEGAVTAESPAAVDGEKSALDAVLAALDGNEESPASDEHPGEAEADAKADGADKAKDDPAKTEEDGEVDSEQEDTELSEAEMAKLNEKTRSRINQLLDQRRMNAEEASTAKAEVEKLRPAAESFQRITDFMREHDMAPQDAGRALHLAGLIQTDPIAAFKVLQPIYAQLAQLAGAALPQDIAEDLRGGLITQQRAQELAQARAAQAVTQRQGESARARQQQAEQDAAAEREREAKRDHAGQMATIGDRLAATAAQADPDWKLKEPLVVDKLRLGILEKGMPKDEAELKARFDGAVKDVTTYLRSLEPRSKPSHRPVSSNSSPAQHSEPPKDAQEAILRALD